VELILVQVSKILILSFSIQNVKMFVLNEPET